MKRICSLIDIQQRLLSLGSACSAVCDRHGIPYVMLGGTMLGAVRHRGFIPWDDDMDFAVPREHYEQLITLLERELPGEYKCLTYKDCEQIKYPFIKIEDTRTCIDDPRLNCPLEEKIGINVDVFPLDVCNINGWKIKWIYFLLKLQTLLFVESTSPSFLKDSIRTILRFLMSVKKNYLLERIETMLKNNTKGDYIGNIYGRWKMKEVFKSEIYNSTCSYEFEGLNFKGVENYHSYLTQMYGDYMMLPPEEKRIVHVDNVYLRCK